MTYKQFPATFLKTFAIVALAVLLIFTGAAAAEKSFFIDTTGLTGNVGETTLVPVKVTGAENLYSIELQCGLGETADYKIVFNETSMEKYFYSQNTGRVAQINLKVNGDVTLFYLEVTPKAAKPVHLSLTSFLIQEGTEDTKITKADYTATGAILNIEGGTTPTPTPTETTPTPTPSVTPSPTPSVTPSPTPSTPSGGSSGQPSVIPTTTPTPSETVPTTTPTPSETVPTTIPTTTPTSSTGSGGVCIPCIIAVLGILAFLIIIIVVKRRKDDEEE